MRRSGIVVAGLAAACALRPGPAAAQDAAREARDLPAADAEVAVGGIRPLGVAKWGSLGATLAAAAYGFAASFAADDHYDRIERLCAADAPRCDERRPDGAYVDPELERLEHDAAGLDRRARIGLLASQVGVAASVVLFILDLRDTGAPPNVPYDPSRLRIGAARDGGIRVGVAVPTR